MTDKIYIDYFQYLEDIRLLARKIKNSNDKYDSIIGISRGGLIPAAILAHRLNIKHVYSYGIRSYEDVNIQANIQTYQPIPNDFNGKKILIVDDIIDSKKTIMYVKNTLESKFKNKNFSYSTIYTKENLPEFLEYKSKSFMNDEWIVFPYDF